MKMSKVLMVLCIAMFSIFVFGTISMAYARTGIDPADAEGGQAVVEQKLPPATPPDKGSPMHGWKAIVAGKEEGGEVIIAGKKAGDTITTAEFEQLRNWSHSTRGYELQSLAAIGVLKRVSPGVYELLVDATPDQIDEINRRAIPIVNKQGRVGEGWGAVGIDYWILDVKHLGKGRLEDIAGIVKEVTTNSAVTALPADSIDFVQEDINNGTPLPASVAINGDRPFTINGESLERVTAEPVKQQALLAGLVDARIVSPEGRIKGEAYDFNPVPVKTVLFKDGFVVGDPIGFKKAFDGLVSDETAVIVTINTTNNDIETALRTAGLFEQWGNRIVVMGVTPESPSAHAFEALFKKGDGNIYDLRGKKIEEILDDKNLVEGLAGAV